MATLKDALQDRLRILQAQRQEITQQAQAQVAVIDGKITALRTLYQQWDTLTIEQGLAAIHDAGITLKVD